MTQLRLPAPGKLNLLLHITGQRADGYHELETLFQFIDLADELLFQLNSNGEIELTPELPDVALEDHLVWRAAKKLAPLRASPQVGITIQLQKNLPMGGGLGAGSSDAATTLLALNQLWQLNLTLEQLAVIGLELGADVPVFVKGHSAWATGIGEQLTPLACPEIYYLLIHPGCHCPTARFFQHPELPRSTPSIQPEQSAAFIGSNDFSDLAKQLFPSIAAGLKWLEDQGLKACLTGTGACIYAPLTSLQQGQALVKQLPTHFAEQPTQGWVVRGRNQSPAHLALNLI